MPAITLNPTAQRFEMQVDGQTAYVAFERSGNVIALTHTIVPETVGGRGIGSELARHALDYAAARHLRVRPDCSFIASYIDKHPDYRPLLA